MSRLDEDQIAERLGELAGWELDGEAIHKAFKHDDFVNSVEFVKAIVEPAEEMNHHPDLAISWDTVEVTLSTHSEGGLTGADFDLAARIDSL